MSKPKHAQGFRGSLVRLKREPPFLPVDLFKLGHRRNNGVFDGIMAVAGKPLYPAGSGHVKPIGNSFLAFEESAVLKSISYVGLKTQQLFQCEKRLCYF